AESESIAPNQSKTFQFTMTAPATPGTYNFQGRMVHEGVEWFGDSTPNVAVTVTVTPPAAVNAAQFVSQSVPASMVAGQSYAVSVTMQNTGTTTWTAAGEYKLGSQNPQGNGTWGTGRVEIAAGESIGPGQSKTFTYTVTAPAAPGIYAFQWRMLREQVEWFGDFTTYVAVTVGDVGSQASPFGVVSAAGIGNDPRRQDDLKALGAGWARVAFDWPNMEPTKGNIQWDLPDRIVNELTARGINVYWDFSYAPCWANGRPLAPGGGCLNPDDEHYPPLNQQDLYDFVYAVVSRYQDRVRYWGTWNEINLNLFYRGGVDRFVANELQTTVNAIKAADPTAKVVVGELSSSGNEFPHLKKILDSVRGRFDVISHHVYDGGDTCDGRLAETIDPLRDSLVSWGYGAFPLWVTETGLKDSEAAKGSYLTCFYDAMKARPWWAKTFWYRYEFDGTPGSSFGLLDGGPDVYTPNETYFTYQSYIRGPVTNAAAFVSQTVPASMVIGQTYTVSVTMQNTGTSTWTAAGEYKLGSQNPQDNGIWGTGRVNLAAADRIAPNQSKTFTFTVTAPSTLGTYNFQWRMLRELVEWFGEFTPNVTITVSPPAPTVGSILPVSGTIAGATAVTISGGNFVSGATVTLGGVAATNVAVASATTLTAVTGAHAVGAVDVVVRNPDGQSATLTNGFTYTVPLPVNAAQFVSQSVPASMVAGQSYAVSVTMQNRGTLTWTASSHRLGSQNPQDNVTWGGNRVYLAESESIAPNQSKTFQFTMTAPATPGTYNFQGRMVHEGVEWFG
ncbi:MAG: NBR1-Ig-like domain-containing protein, partial [Thermoanaerobaculia bacterium]